MRSELRQVRRRHLRHGVLQISLLLGTVVVLGRAFQLQVVQAERWRDLAVQNHTVNVGLPAPRGAIFDRHGRELAVSRISYDLYVAPNELEDPEAALPLLREVAELPAKHAKWIREGKPVWVRLARRISEAEKDELEKVLRKGLHPEPVAERRYPLSRLAAEIVGSVGEGGRGQSGLELSFDSLLTGQPGTGIRRRDAKDESAAWPVVPVVAPTAGHDLYLTIDAELQALAESVLEGAIVETDASGGDLVILEPSSGELLAVVSRRRGRRIQNLTAVTEPYEAGSTLKPFTAAALLAEGLAKLTDIVDTGNGRYRAAGRTIRDDNPRGRLSLAQTLAVSSNVGMALFAERLPEGVQYRYLRDFGFGTPTGLAYPSESGGLLRKPSQWSKQSRASLAIGYEVSVTPLQLALAYGALANGGLLMRPQLVREVRGPEGQLRWKGEAEVVRRAIDEDVASLLRDVLVEAVTQGTGRSADVQGVRVAGKTGTAWRFDRERGYAGHTYTSSFAGLIPAEQPEWVMLVKLDAPSGQYYGGATAAPVMRTAVRAALAGSYWSAPPLLGEPESPGEQAGIPASRVAASGPYVFALDAPLLRASEETAWDERGSETVVPEIRGQSLRAAVHQLHQAGLQVVARGGGRVVSVEPGVGVRLHRGARVVIVGGERASPPATDRLAGEG
ncbi:MAG: PASTA domain-containing protein [Gemmatimonadota bacterium]|nr:MAG: PASTA domain-containing protein [Gemmatimonadota bacterium]